MGCWIPSYKQPFLSLLQHAVPLPILFEFPEIHDALLVHRNDLTAGFSLNKFQLINITSIFSVGLARNAPSANADVSRLLLGRLLSCTAILLSFSPSFECLHGRPNQGFPT